MALAGGDPSPDLSPTALQSLRQYESRGGSGRSCLFNGRHRHACSPAGGSCVRIARIKPRTGERPLTVGAVSPDRFYRPDITLKALVQFAYDLWDFQVDGGPEWVRSDRWSIEAKATGPQRPAAMRLMVRRLLAERFGLQTHLESRELPTYELLMARRDGRLGPNLKAATVDCRPFLTGERPRDESPREDASGFPRCSTGGRSVAGAFTPRLNGQPISALARLLEPIVRRRVIDRTGLQGIFDVE